MDAAPAPELGAVDRDRVVAILVANHRAFLRFLERRLGDRALAEDVMQEAFARHLDRLTALPDEALVPWFYRVLRNAAIDRLRRAGTEAKALAAFARELGDGSTPPDDVRHALCGCISELASTLTPEYARVLQAVEVEGQPVSAFAAAAGITASNAGVRLFRARAALRKLVTASCGTCAEHGCVDCSCGEGRLTAAV